MIHTFQGESIYFDIAYKKRKTASIQVNIYGLIQVHVPKGCEEEKIIQLVESKWDWILEKTREMKDRLEGPKENTYDTGETYLYLGKQYPIQLIIDPEIKKENVNLTDSSLQVFVRTQDDEKIKQALKRFYYKQCKKITEKRIRYYQGSFKVKPKSITISDNTSNWGTCDSYQNITFNWKLAMAPESVIDYVVVHEMCHMVHMNHDRSFWRLVGKIIPDYEKKQNWLALSSWKMIV